MWERTVAVGRSAAAAALARVVVVVFALSVRVAVIVVAGRPVQGGMIVGTGLSYGGHWWRGRGWRGIPSVGRGGGDAPGGEGFVVKGQFGGFVVGLGRGGELGGAAAASEGPAFGGVDRGCHGVWSGHPVGANSFCAAWHSDVPFLSGAAFDMYGGLPFCLAWSSACSAVFRYAWRGMCGILVFRPVWHTRRYFVLPGAA